VTSAQQSFHITLSGEVGPATREAFADVDVHVADGHTVLSGQLVDQAGLHGLLERVQALGLVLVELRVEE
jgi:hypothetical protein